jgi:hypothetical protein
MEKFIEDGKITEIWLDLIIVIGLLIMGLSYFFIETRWLKITLMSVGLVIGYISGFASKAQIFGLKPFDKSYDKARNSYKDEKEKD